MQWQENPQNKLDRLARYTIGWLVIGPQFHSFLRNMSYDTCYITFNMLLHHRLWCQHCVAGSWDVTIQFIRWHSLMCPDCVTAVSSDCRHVTCPAITIRQVTLQALKYNWNIYNIYLQYRKSVVLITSIIYDFYIDPKDK